jgi:hypothetical protein
VYSGHQALATEPRLAMEAIWLLLCVALLLMGLQWATNRFLSP